MSEVLEFPPIIDPLPAAAPAPAAPKSAASNAIAELAGKDLTAVALARFGDWRPKVAELVQRIDAEVLDVSTPKGLERAKALRMEIREPRYNAQKVATAAKSELAKVSKAIGAELEAITNATKATEDRLHSSITTREEEIEAERKRRAEAEAARVAAHQSKLATIRGYAEQAKGKGSEVIAKGLEFIKGLAIGPEWEEFQAQAQAEKEQTIVTVEQALQDALAAEAETRRLIAQRAEQERIAAEQAAQAAELERQRAELEREREELRRQQQEAENAAQQVVERAAADVAEAAVPKPADEPAHAAPIVSSPRYGYAGTCTRKTGLNGEECGLQAPCPDCGPSLVDVPALDQTEFIAPVAEVATLSLGDINALLGNDIRVSVATLSALGFEPHDIVRNSRLYRRDKVPEILGALELHIAQVAASFKP